MIISIPDSVLAESKMSEQDILIEIAVTLYGKGVFTIGQARKLANLDLISFQKELAKRNVYIHYSVDDLEKDLKNLGLQ